MKKLKESPGYSVALNQIFLYLKFIRINCISVSLFNLAAHYLILLFNFTLSSERIPPLRLMGAQLRAALKPLGAILLWCPWGFRGHLVRTLFDYLVRLSRPFSALSFVGEIIHWLFCIIIIIIKIIVLLFIVFFCIIIVKIISIDILSLVLFIGYFTSRRQKLALSLRESVSWHNGGPVDGLPWTPQCDSAVMYRCFQRGTQFVPHDADRR